MDFHTLSRRELQTLCKKNKIPANITNVAMADALANLTNVEGIHEIGNGELLMQTPQTCKGSRITKPIKDSVVSMEIESGSSIALTRPRRGTQVRNSQEMIENPLDILKTPATRGRRKAVGSVCKKIDSENNQDITAEEEKNNGIEKEESVVSQVRTRRSVRLSEKKACVSVPKKGGRKTEAIKISALSEEESDEIQEDKGASHVVPEDASSMVVSDITTEETPTAESEESSLATQLNEEKALVSEEVLDGIKHISLSDTTETPNVVSDGSLVGIQGDGKVIVCEDISHAKVSVDNFTTDDNSNGKSQKASFVDSKVMPEDGSDRVVFDFEEDVSDARDFAFELLGDDDIDASKENVDVDQILTPVDDVSTVNANQNLIPGDSPVAVTADSESVPLNSAAGGEFSDANQSRVYKNSIQEEVLDILKMKDHSLDANADIMESDNESSDETSPKQLTSSESIEASAVGQLDREMFVFKPSTNEMTFENCEKMLEIGEGSEMEDSETVDKPSMNEMTFENCEKMLETGEGSETEESETDDDSEGSEMEDSEGSEAEAKEDVDPIGSIGRSTTENIFPNMSAVTPKSSNKKKATPTSKMTFKVYSENEENISGEMSSKKKATPISKLLVAEDKENNKDGDGTQKRALKQKSLRQLRKMFKNKLALENNHGKLEKARPALQALTDNRLVDNMEN